MWKILLSVIGHIHGAIVAATVGAIVAATIAYSVYRRRLSPRVYTTGDRCADDRLFNGATNWRSLGPIAAMIAPCIRPISVEV